MANLLIDKRNSTHAVDEFGHEGNDTLLGSRFGDKLKGAQGNDTIEGNGGNDQIMDLTWIGPEPDFGGLFSRNLSLESERRAAAGFASENIEIGSQVIGQFLFHGGNDRFFGGAGNDFLLGLEGNDRLDGGSGVDVLLGGSGDDTMIGGAGADVFGGGQGRDYMLGGSGDDIMNGGANNDRLEGGSGADLMIGGVGFDVVVYSQSAGAVSVNLRLGVGGSLSSPAGDESSGDRYEGIENVDGSRNNDSIIGNDGENRLFGGLGNDFLAGRGGADRLIGDGGIDTASYADSAGAVTVRLDDASVGLQSVAFGGDAQGDKLTSIENLVGSRFDDNLTGNSVANRIDGGDGNDTISGLEGNDTLFGRGGRDTITGGDGNDVISGGDGADRLSGGEGNDSLTGAAGGDTINGGGGNDTVSFAENSNGVTVTLAGEEGEAKTFIAFGGTIGTEKDLLIDIENVVGSARGDIIAGDANRNILNGGSGNDTFLFSTGGDTFDGDGGIDKIDMHASTLGATIDLRQGRLTLDGSAEVSTLREIEDVVGTDLNDTITGSAAGNRLFGGDGKDRLSGGGGNDRIDGGASIDTVTFAENNRGVAVTLAEAGQEGHARELLVNGQFGAEDDILIDVENILGTVRNDTIAGNSAQNFLSGGLGDDTFQFSTGGDTINGDGGSDSIVMDFAASGATIDLAAGRITVAGASEVTTLNSIENVTATAFDDTITGSSAANRIVGGLGTDQLTGGSGNDTFVFNTTAEIGLVRGSRDIIHDFAVGDRIDLHGVSNEMVFPGATLSFIGNTGFTGVAGQVHTTITNSGSTIVLIDINGDATTDARIQMDGVHDLATADFIF